MASIQNKAKINKSSTTMFSLGGMLSLRLIESESSTSSRCTSSSLESLGSKIIKQYIENDLMTRFLQGKIKNKQLYDIVDLIDKGDDKKLEEDLAKKEVKLSQKRYAKQLEKQKEKEKKQEEELEQQRIESKKETDLKKNKRN